jgi:hypothetical protein
MMLRLFSCLMARDQVSYPYKMKGKTVVGKKIVTKDTLNDFPDFEL